MPPFIPEEDPCDVSTPQNATEIHKTILSKLTFLCSIPTTTTEPPQGVTQTTVVRSQLRVIISLFETSPQLLDAHLHSYITILSQHYLRLKAASTQPSPPHLDPSLLTAGIQAVCDLGYTFVKVRGLKAVTSCFESDLYTIETLLSYLQPSTPAVWQENYFVLLWLSIMVLMPFPLTSINPQLPHRLFTQLHERLEAASTKHGRESEVASYCLAKFLTRTDSIATGYLHQYYTSVNPIHSLRCMNHLLKTAQPQALEPFLDTHLTKIQALLAQPESPGDTLLVVKNLKNLAANYTHLQTLYLTDPTKPDYDIQIEVVVAVLVEMVGAPLTTDGRCGLAKALARTTQPLPLAYQLDVINHTLVTVGVPSTLLQSLTLGVTEANRKHYVSPEGLEQFTLDAQTLPHELYHTVLLFMAELLRTSALPTAYFPLLDRLLEVFCFFKQPRGASAAGSQLRDACCFIAWAMFRNYLFVRRGCLLGMACISRIGRRLLLMTCFDSDLTVRRAGAAGIQELVGRFGGGAFNPPHLTLSTEASTAVKLIEELDYVRLGSVERSFASAVGFTTHLPFLKDFFADFLLTQGVVSLEYELRAQSAQLLAVFANEDEALATRAYNHLETQWLEEVALKHPSEGLLAAIAHLIPVVAPEPARLVLLLAAMEKMTFNFHTDPFYKGLEFLQALGAVLRASPLGALLPLLMTSLFEVIRIDHPAVVTAFQVLCPHLYLGAEDWGLFLKYLRLGNLATAKAVGYIGGIGSDQERLALLVALLQDSHVQAASRAALMGSFSVLLQTAAPCGPNGDGPNPQLLWALVQQLDDYTTTPQGDVGSKLRLATVKTLSRHLEIFLPQFRLEIEGRLLRLCGEVMDTLKYAALALVLRMQAVDPEPLLNSETGEGYYETILRLYQQFYLDPLVANPCDRLAELSLCFWQGFVFSAGALSASTYTISLSFTALLKFLKRLSEAGRLQIFDNLLTLMKPQTNTKAENPPAGFEGKTQPIVSKGRTQPAVSKGAKTGAVNDRKLKAQLCALNTFVYLMDSGTSFPSEFNTRLLYVRAYNLHLNTASIERVLRVITLFCHLTLIQLRHGNSVAFTDPLERLGWLVTRHPMLRARQLAAEGMFQIYEVMAAHPSDPPSLQFLKEAMSTLQRVDWTQPHEVIQAEGLKVVFPSLVPLGGPKERA